MGGGSDTAKVASDGGRDRRWPRRAWMGVGCAVVLAGGGLGVVAVGQPWTSAGEPTYTPFTPGPPAPADWVAAGPVFTPPDVDPAPTTALPMDDVLDDVANDPGFGPSVGISVVSLETGNVRYEHGAAAPRIPASTLKILTAVAALDRLGPGHVFRTSVATSEDDLAQGALMTLVGGGDPTLTSSSSAPGGQLPRLADLTAAALDQAGVTAIALAYDDSLFTGPAVDPDWRPSYVPSVVSPVSALAVDVGQRRPADPAGDAATTFAALLDQRGIAVTPADARASARAGIREIASVSSPPLSRIVEDMLTSSDNDAAEVLARHVAVASGRPGTSADAGEAVVEALTALGFDLTTSAILDGSGLARGNAVPAATITAALTLAADPAHPDLRAVLSGLPVAGFTGTLADRFDDVDDAHADPPAATGAIRAKTGTLTGVNGLAGVVVGRDGQTWAFGVLSDQIADTTAARAATDRFAAAVAACGCR